MQFRRNLESRHLRATRGRGQPYVASSYAFSAALLTLFLSICPVQAATLQYDAFLSGIPVGTAVVELEISDSAYRISGVAASQGVAHLFSDWRSDFLAVGYLQEGSPVLTAYAYDEREKNKQRVLRLSGGTVRHVKNHKVRPSHPVLNGTDVLTAFFLQPACWSERQIHTGRYSYRVIGRPSSETGGCHFEVSDSDGDRTRFHVRFSEHNGLRIPVEARTKGVLRGRIRLRSMATSSPESKDGDDLLLAERAP